MYRKEVAACCLLSRRFENLPPEARAQLNGVCRSRGSEWRRENILSNVVRRETEIGQWPRIRNRKWNKEEKNEGVRRKVFMYQKWVWDETQESSTLCWVEPFVLRLLGSALCWGPRLYPRNSTPLLSPVRELPDLIDAEVRKNYEGWNFNSGNYLFTTDTK